MYPDTWPDNTQIEAADAGNKDSVSTQLLCFPGWRLMLMLFCWSTSLANPLVNVCFNEIFHRQTRRFSNHQNTKNNNNRLRVLISIDMNALRLFSTIKKMKLKNYECKMIITHFYPLIYLCMQFTPVLILYLLCALAEDYSSLPTLLYRAAGAAGSSVWPTYAPSRNLFPGLWRKARNQTEGLASWGATLLTCNMWLCLRL